MTTFITKNNTTDQTIYLVTFKLHIPVNNNAMRNEHVFQVTIVVLRISEQIQTVSWPIVWNLNIKQYCQENFMVFDII